MGFLELFSPGLTIIVNKLEKKPIEIKTKLLKEKTRTYNFIKYSNIL